MQRSILIALLVAVAATCCLADDPDVYMSTDREPWVWTEPFESCPGLPNFPSVTGYYQNKVNDVIVISGCEGIYKYDYDLNLLEEWDTYAVEWIVPANADEDGVIYFGAGNLLYWANISESNGLADAQEFEFVGWDDASNWVYQLAVDTENGWAYAVSPYYNKIMAIDFDNWDEVAYEVTYSPETDNIWFDTPAYPNGWAIAVDSANQLLYIGTSNYGWEAPVSEGQVWQFDVSDPDAVTLKNHVTVPVGSAFETAFVHPASGFVWFVDYSTQQLLAFRPDDLSWSSHFQVSTVSWVGGVGVDLERNQAFLVDGYLAGSGVTQWNGGVYRVCLNDRYPDNILEDALAWLPSTYNMDADVVYYDNSSGEVTIVVAASTAAFFTVETSEGTDCSQEYTPSPASTMTSFFVELVKLFF